MTPPRLCQRLDSKGWRCRRRAIRSVHYHGDNEIYTDLYNEKGRVEWVRVWLCPLHLQAQGVWK